MLQQVMDGFRRHFGRDPSLAVRAPGRVNLIGEHTDYNGGFVLPMAIERAVWIAAEPVEGECVTLHSLDFSEQMDFHLDRLEKTGGGWGEYAKGVAWALGEEGFRLRGWRGVVAGNVPLGSGLSSSAAVELAIARVFAEISRIDIDPKRMALLCQKAENDWVGVNCGIMDQMISSAGEEGKALLIDCRSLELAPVPLPRDTAVIVMDTGTRRRLADSAYNERRRQCEETARHFGVPFLCDVDVEEFERRTEELPEEVRRRSRHVIMENARTLRAAEVLRQGDAAAFGVLMNESHESLRADFEVSSPALDAISAIARAQAGCLGARMTGAGFGGCAIALAEASAAGTIVKNVDRAYREATGNEPEFYITTATAGAQRVWP